MTVNQITEAVGEVVTWLDGSAAAATTEDFNEQKERLADLVNPITSQLYGGGSGRTHMHDEL